jgi:hypothetical protein
LDIADLHPPAGLQAIVVPSYKGKRQAQPIPDDWDAEDEDEPEANSQQIWEDAYAIFSAVRLI